MLVVDIEMIALLKETTLLLFKIFFISIGMYYVFFQPTHYWKTMIAGLIFSIFYTIPITIVKYRVYKSNLE